MFERFERPVKIICLALAALLAWQLGSLLLGGDPLANLKIPALPTLAEATNEPAKGGEKEIALAKTGTNGMNGANGTNATVKTTNNTAAGPTAQTGTNSAAKHAGPPAMAMMGGAMPGGRRGGGMKKAELTPEVQARVDKIINSEILGAVIHPMPMALIGIADSEAFIQATNGQTDAVKLGGEMGGIKLLRIGVNRVLVEADGEKKELTIFDGIGGESLMPKTKDEPSTNAAATNAPAKKAAKRKAAENNTSTNQTLSSKQKETP